MMLRVVEFVVILSFGVWMMVVSLRLLGFWLPVLEWWLIVVLCLFIGLVGYG